MTAMFRKMFVTVILFTVAIFCALMIEATESAGVLCAMLGAQSGHASTGGKNSANPRTAAPDAWARVEQLAPNSRRKISATRNGGDSILQSVSVDGLVCRHGRSTGSVRRAEINSIKLAHRGHSAAGGLAIGAAVGAGAGAGIGSAINSCNTGSIVHVSGGGISGRWCCYWPNCRATVGGLIGYRNDLFSGPVIYKR